jgi:cytochrome c5
MQDHSPQQHKALRNIHIAVVVLCMTLLGGAALVTQSMQGRFAQAAAVDSSAVQASAPADAIVDGKDVETGLIAADGYLTVKQNCTSCHSAKLITQNHLSRDRWEKTIRWMQKNQNLGDLGANEPIILDYLAQYYGAANQGRRKPLETPVWYELE